MWENVKFYFLCCGFLGDFSLQSLREINAAFTVARGPVPRDRCITVTRAVFFTVARGPVPRDRCPPSVGQERLLLTRSGAGAPELRSFPRSRHGEGQALALR